MGKPGFPSSCLWGWQALPTGRVWEGEAFPRTSNLPVKGGGAGPSPPAGKAGGGAVALFETYRVIMDAGGTPALPG